VKLDELRVDIVILACAVSAGVHGALVPDHFHEGTGPGVGFVLGAVLPAGLAVVLTHRPTRLALAFTAAVLAGLIASYAVAVTTGIPVLHPDVEAVDGLALVTKAVEAAGLLTAVGLVRHPRLRITLFQPKGTTT
jgi:VIT1/CCC1 family predicted Fe2+/Mn2+ transporter